MELLAQWNLALSAIQPLVLLVEDLHWCDASSLELLGRLIAQSADGARALRRDGAPGVHAALAGALEPDHACSSPASPSARRAT